MDKYIVTTRPAGMNEFLTKNLTQQGKLVYELPAINISPKELLQNEIQIIKNITEFDWIIFTSANGVKAFIKILDELSIPISSIQDKKIGVIGPATAKAVTILGLRISFQPSIYISSLISKEIGDIKDNKILLLRADIASKELEYELGAKGAIVTNISIYHTIYRQETDTEFAKLIEEDKIACITFTSSSTVTGFMQQLSDGQKRKILSQQIVCIGPVTAKTAKEVGFDKIKIAEEYTMEGILNTLTNL